MTENIQFVKELNDWGSWWDCRTIVMGFNRFCCLSSWVFDVFLMEFGLENVVCTVFVVFNCKIAL
jgi:hypothetical protein